MRRLTFESFTDSEAATIRFGEQLGAALRSGAVIGLTGPLGAGKTRLVQGMARGAGYAGRVRSPTFALMHVYSGRMPVRHFDLYRLDDLDSATMGEWQEAMEEFGVSFVEWADRVAGLLPEEAIRIDLVPVLPERRRIRLVLPLDPPPIDVWSLR
jgi:tRNA threonylcarbamoyladenosine biosynthesis protein TsaE